MHFFYSEAEAAQKLKQLHDEQRKKTLGHSSGSDANSSWTNLGLRTSLMAVTQKADIQFPDPVFPAPERSAIHVHVQHVSF